MCRQSARSHGSATEQDSTAFGQRRVHRQRCDCMAISSGFGVAMEAWRSISPPTSEGREVLLSVKSSAGGGRSVQVDDLAATLVRPLRPGTNRCTDGSLTVHPPVGGRRVQHDERQSCRWVPPTGHGRPIPRPFEPVTGNGPSLAGDPPERRCPRNTVVHSGFRDDPSSRRRHAWSSFGHPHASQSHQCRHDPTDWRADVVLGGPEPTALVQTRPVAPDRLCLVRDSGGDQVVATWSTAWRVTDGLRPAQ